MKIFVFIILLFFPAVGFSTPSISGVTGTIEDGETITISGTGFTTHADNDDMGTDYLCTWWDNFDSYAGLCSGSPALVDEYNFSSGSCVEQCDSRYMPDGLNIDSSIKRGTQSIEKTADVASVKMRPGSDCPTPGEIDIFDSSGVIYFSWWLYFPSNYDLPEGNYQSKLARFYDGGAVGGGEDFYPGTVDPDHLGHHSDNDCTNGTCIATTSNFIDIQDTIQGTAFRGYWHRMEIWFDADNDELQYYVDGHLYYDCNASYGSNCIPGDWVNSGVAFFSIAEVHTPSTYNSWHFDDLYANRTWARVEITQTNEFTVDTSKKLVKNIQLPKTWGTTEITADLNLEGLSGTVYLWVVDSDGVVSSSEELEIGEGNGNGNTGEGITSIGITLE